MRRNGKKSSTRLVVVFVAAMCMLFVAVLVNLESGLAYLKSIQRESSSSPVRIRPTTTTTTPVVVITPQKPEPTSLPAPLFDGRVFAWGARITMVSPNEPYFEIFFQGTHYVKEKPKVFFRAPTNITLLDTDEVLRGMRFVCHVPGGGDKGPYLHSLTHRANYNLDAVPQRFMQRFLCPLPPIIGPVLRIELRAASATPSDDAEEEEEDDSPQPPPVHLSNFSSVWLDIPTHSESIGLAGPMNSAHLKPFRQQPRVEHMLCVGGVRPNGLHIVPEFLQHHIKLGFQHFMVGVDVDKDALLVSNATLLLQPLIDAGVVVLYAFATPQEHMISIDKGNLAKNVFFEACLSYAKGKAKYVANWDLDEFWMPSVIDVNHTTPTSFAPRSIVQHQLDVYRTSSTAKDEPCPNWCFVSMPSLEIWDRPTKNLPMQQIARGTPNRRRRDPNYVWQKSIGRASNAFNLGAHTFGTCLVNGVRGTRVSDGRQEGCRRKAPEMGLMHHFIALFRDARPNLAEELQPDEYAQWTMRLGYAANVTSLVEGDGGNNKVFVFNRVPGEQFEPPLL